MSQRHIGNAVGHFDIAGPDLDALRSFYAGVFGWTIESVGPGYALIRTPEGGVDGAIVETETPAITLGVVAPNLAQALAAAERLGGAIVMPATDNGWVTKAQIADPFGNIVTLIDGSGERAR